jgi:hypothetical protein
MSQTLYIDITTIVHNLTTSTTVESNRIILHGKITGSSTAAFGDKATINFKNTNYTLDDVPIAIYIERREPRTKMLGTPTSEPWISNDELRDALRIDGLLNNGYAHSQMTIFLNDLDIAVVKQIDLKKQELRFLTEYKLDAKDPRSINEPEIDHFFCYINKNIIQIISKN